MKKYFVAEVDVIFNGEHQIVTIYGQGYDPNVVKGSAENQVRELHPKARITSVILTKKDISLEEFEALTGTKPPWSFPSR